ncbi:hypothetical protein C8R44DRAFT_740715 [Mycena epipterygia]|nr:hypothetical protein C8R44DRAFT_740715 [Mycena epipterygia]
MCRAPASGWIRKEESPGDLNASDISLSLYAIDNDTENASDVRAVPRTREFLQRQPIRRSIQGTAATEPADLIFQGFDWSQLPMLVEASDTCPCRSQSDALAKRRVHR